MDAEKISLNETFDKGNIDEFPMENITTFNYNKCKCLYLINLFNLL